MDMSESSKKAMTAAIAAAITRERKKAGLSLSALAAKAGLSKSTLSQLEAGGGNPSVETLWAIATALGIPFSFVFEAPPARTTLMRAGEGKRIEAESSAFQAVLLASCAPQTRHDIYQVALSAGKPHCNKAHPRGTLEHLIVMEGEVRAGPEGAEEVLQQGDYYAFPGDEPHLYEALSPHARIMLVMESG